jgi:hypothetical protein
MCEVQAAAVGHYVAVVAIGQKGLSGKLGG